MSHVQGMQAEFPTREVTLNEAKQLLESSGFTIEKSSDWTMRLADFTGTVIHDGEGIRTLLEKGFKLLGFQLVLKPVMTVEEYVQNDCSACPYCESTNISSVEGIALSDSVGHMSMRCRECHVRWTDVYKVISFELEED